MDFQYDEKAKGLVMRGAAFIMTDDTNNFRQQLLLRCLTEKGELVFDPDYGTTAYTKLNKRLTPSVIDEIRADFIDCVMADYRTLSAEAEIVIEDSRVKIRISAVSKDGDTVNFDIEEGIG